MKTNFYEGSLKKGAALLAVVAVACLSGLFSRTGSLSSLRAQSDPNLSAAELSPVFTPAHKSVGEAVRHFFGMRPTPVQPIPFPHKTHIAKEVECVVCHQGVDKGPLAGIPNLNTCMSCHAYIAEDHELIIKITKEYYEKGIDLPWQRVYGWNEESHVRFNHAPHIRANVGCVTCHGDLSKMTVAERVVDHTMGFCVDCHTEKKAPNDCQTCHY